MGNSVDQHMTEIDSFVDEFCKGHPALAHWRHSPHAQPQFSDAQVLTVALRQGVFAVATRKQTYPAGWRTTGGRPSRLCPPTSRGSPACITCFPWLGGCGAPPADTR